MSVSKESAELLLRVLDSIQIPATEEAIAQITQARTELRSVLAEPLPKTKD